MDYSEYTDVMLENLLSDLHEEVRHFDEDDLQDPALNAEYQRLCRTIDDAEMEQMARVA